jgi:hypothetical protein
MNLKKPVKLPKNIQSFRPLTTGVFCISIDLEITTFEVSRKEPKAILVQLN